MKASDLVMKLLRLATLAVATALACSVIIDTDESDLVPCSDPPMAPRIVFPLNNSGVIGDVQVMGISPGDCSGVEDLTIGLSDSHGTTTPIAYLRPETLEGDFATSWETSSWPYPSEAVRLIAELVPIRSTVAVQRSEVVRVSVFELCPTMSLYPSWQPPRFWALVDLDDDGDRDVIWEDRVSQVEVLHQVDWSRLSQDDLFTLIQDPCAVWSERPLAFESRNKAVFHAYCDGRPDACAEQSDDVAVALDFLTAGFLDRDSVMDLVAWERIEPQGRLLLFHGRMSPLEGWTLEVPIELPLCLGARAISATLVDVNLDGSLEILLLVDDPAEEAVRVAVLQHESERAWSCADIGVFNPLPRAEYGEIFISAGDLFGDDGFPDLAFGVSGGQTVVYANAGHSAPPRYNWRTTLEISPPLQLVDFDRDGDLDIASPFTGSGLWRQNRERFDDREAREASYPGGILADINNDGLLDAGAHLGTPEGSFLSTGVIAWGVPVNMDGGGEGQTLDLFRGVGEGELSINTLSHVSNSARLIVGVDLPEGLPGNRFGLGARVRVTVVEDGDPEEPSNEDEAAPSLAEIGPLWSGALLDRGVSFGADSERLYDVSIRLPLADEDEDRLCADVPGDAVLTLGEDQDGDGRLDCRIE